jgi:hypothetical protein
MHFDGFAGKGVCPAGGGHEAAGFNFVLPHDVGETDTAQQSWRFCKKCEAMFFDGFPEKGVCPAGGGHEAAGFKFVLPHDVDETPTAQQSWRFCPKCHAMHFDGFPEKGVCPAGGGHGAAGFNFVLPHADDGTVVFDSGSLTSGLSLGGSVKLIMTNKGDFTFSAHAHDSGFDNIDYVVSAVLMMPNGLAFTFQHQGHLEGTTVSIPNPFNKPKRDDDPVIPGNNPSITNEFGGMGLATLQASVDGKDTLVGGLEKIVNDLLNQAAQQLEKAGAAAVVALVV